MRFESRRGGEREKEKEIRKLGTIELIRRETRHKVLEQVYWKDGKVGKTKLLRERFRFTLSNIKIQFFVRNLK